MTEPRARPRVFQALLWLPQNRNLFVFWTGQVVSNFGDRVHWLVVGLLVIELTGSALQTGLYYALTVIPEVLLGFLAGVVADRANRRALMASMDFVRVGLVATIPLMAAAGFLRVEYLYGVVVALAVCNVFFDTASGAFIPQIVPKEDLPAANSALLLAVQSAMLLGPLAGGSLAATLGLANSLWITSGGYLVSATAMLLVRTTQPASTEADRRGVRDDLAEGLRYALSHPAVRAISFKSLGANLALGASITMAMFHFRHNVGLDTPAMGVAFSAAGAAAIAGAATGAALGRRLGIARAGTMASYLEVAGMVVLASVASFWGLAVGYVMIGFGVSVANVNYSAARQTVVSPEMQGRAWAFERTVSLASFPIGTLAAGVVAELTSPQLVFLAAAVVVFVAATYAWYGGLRDAFAGPAQRPQEDAVHVPAASPHSERARPWRWRAVLVAVFASGVAIGFALGATLSSRMPSPTVATTGSPPVAAARSPDSPTPVPGAWTPAPPSPGLVASTPEPSPTATTPAVQPAAIPAPATASALYAAQVGAYRDRANAEAVAARLHELGYSPAVRGAGGWYRVTVGEFDSPGPAQRLVLELRDRGFEAFVRRIR
ncbi:MAG: MFS transporter [Armatimonadota bacterium]|nr:MFS transporter [Armatimonadota bacterium]